jgi:hypothetical protein
MLQKKKRGKQMRDEVSEPEVELTTVDCPVCKVPMGWPVGEALTKKDMCNKCEVLDKLQQAHLSIAKATRLVEEL